MTDEHTTRRSAGRRPVGIAAAVLLAGTLALVLSRKHVPPEATLVAGPPYLSQGPAVIATGTLPAAAPEIISPLEVAVFTSSACVECEIVRREVIPQLLATFGRAIRISSYDVTDTSAYLKLTEHERRAGSTEQVTAKLFVGNRYLAGADEIAAKAVQLVQETLAERPSQGA